jgi:serine/threonine protein kinase
MYVVDAVAPQQLLTTVRQTNILIGDDYRALVADFGLAIAGHNTQGADTTTGSRGSIPWMAPERFYDTQHRRRTPEMDVYAFGCICYMVRYVFNGNVTSLIAKGQLCSGNHIFYGEREETLIDNVKRGYRPLKPVRSLDGSMVEDDYDRMMRKCWQPLPETRITMLNTLAYFEVDLGRVLVGSPSFIATSRDHCMCCN